MSANLDFEIFSGKTFKDLCREVVHRSENKKDQLDTLIGDLRTLIKGPNDVGQFMPRIKELLEVGVKNDEQLIKLAAVVQRIASAQIEATGGEGAGLTEEDKDKLLKNHLDAVEALKVIKKETEELPVPIPIPK
jgi:hypothetical protein